MEQSFDTEASEAPSETAIIGMQSRDIMDWVDKMVLPMMKKGPIDKVLGFVQKNILNWGNRYSLWPMPLGIKCCALEFAASFNSRYDMERFGIVPRSSPRQCDVLMITGPISMKFKYAVRRLYDQMPEPKWVICMGECSISGGPYFDSYAVVKGADQIMPVDIYIPGCPPRPEALIDGFLKLRDMIRRQGREIYRPSK